MSTLKSIIASGLTLGAVAAKSNAQVALDQTSGNLYKTIVFANGTNTNNSSDSYTIVGPNNRNSASSDVRGGFNGVFAPGSTTPIGFTSSTTIASTKGPEEVGNTMINFDPTTVYEDIMTTNPNSDGIYIQFKRTRSLADTNGDGQHDAHYTGREMISTDPIPVGTILGYKTPVMTNNIGGGTLLSNKTQFKIRDGTSLQETTTTPSGATNIGIAAWTNSTMGTEDSELASSITLYPNPTSDFLQIKLPDSVSEAHYEIYDMTGRLIDHGQISSDESIDLQSVSKGNYIIALTDKNNSLNTTTKQFIKN